MAEAQILFVTRKWAPAIGGMETYCLRLTEELGKIESVETVALSGNTDGSPPSLSALMGFPFTVLKRWRARSRAPRILHLGDMAIWPFGLLAAFSERSQVALSAHGTDVAYHRRHSLRGKLYGAYLRLGARLLRSAVVIANSHATAQVLQETGWKARAVVPLATDLHAAAEPAGRSNSRHILFVGRLVERKGCGWFIRNVLPALPEDIRLRVIGTKWDPAESAALDHPRVEFTGPKPQQELIAEYANAMCVIVPNIRTDSGEYEGFGLVAPEAAACGAVVVAANCDGIIDAVRDGETGLLVESGNAKAWAERILEIAGWSPKKRSEFITRSVTTTQRIFNWHRVAEETHATYDRAA